MTYCIVQTRLKGRHERIKQHSTVCRQTCSCSAMIKVVLLDMLSLNMQSILAQEVSKTGLAFGQKSWAWLIIKVSEQPKNLRTKSRNLKLIIWSGTCLLICSQKEKWKVVVCLIRNNLSIYYSRIRHMPRSSLTKSSDAHRLQIHNVFGFGIKRFIWIPNWQRNFQITWCDDILSQGAQILEAYANICMYR